MANEWQKVRIEDIAEKIAMGPFGSDIKTDNFVPSGVPVIRGGNLSDGRFIGTGFVFLTDEKANDLANANAFPGDIVVTHRGTLGQVGIIPREPFSRYVVSQSQMKLTCDQSHAISEFIYYYLKSPAGQNALLMNTSQTGVPAISRPVTSLKGIHLLLPPIEEQRAIAHILSTLDDKIELNRKQNETLEAMARALFKAWFVDFEPVRAKMEGRWQRGQSLPGLPAHLYDLFPDRLVESELGEIPEGWTWQAAGSVYEVRIGRTPPRKESHWFSQNPTDVPWMSIKDLGRSGLFILEVSEYLTHTAVDRFRVSRIPDATVVLSFKLTVGRVAITDGTMLSNEAIAHFIPKVGNFLSSHYLYCYLRQFEYASLGSTSSIATAVNSDGVRSIPILVPEASISRSFDDLVHDWFSHVFIGQRQSRSLSQLRDTLLPKLISGELRVPEAERFVGLAAA
jgi:type I restriction enzyme, S subunit